MLFVFFYHKYIQFWTILNKISLYKRIRKSNYPEIKYLGKIILKYMFYSVYQFFKPNFKSLQSISAYFFYPIFIHAHTPVWYWLPPQQSSCTTIPQWHSAHFIPSLLFSTISTSWNSHPDITYLNDGHISMSRVRMNMNFYCLPEYSKCW